MVVQVVKITCELIHSMLFGHRRKIITHSLSAFANQTQLSTIRTIAGFCVFVIKIGISLTAEYFFSLSFYHMLQLFQCISHHKVHAEIIKICQAKSWVLSNIFKATEFQQLVSMVDAAQKSILWGTICQKKEDDEQVKCKTLRSRYKHLKTGLLWYKIAVRKILVWLSRLSVSVKPVQDCLEISSWGSLSVFVTNYLNILTNLVLHSGRETFYFDSLRGNSLTDKNIFLPHALKVLWEKQLFYGLVKSVFLHLWAVLGSASSILRTT